MGVIGLVAAATIAVTFANNDPKAAVFYFCFAVGGFIIVTVLAGTARTFNSRGPAIVIIWTTTICFVLAMGMTLSAFAIGCPEKWAQLVGATPSCGVTVAWSAQPAAPVPGQSTSLTDPMQLIAQKFNFEDRSDDCDANRDRTQAVCLPSGFIVEGWEGPVISSANCGSTIAEPEKIVDQPNCVNVTTRLRGCGYDTYLGIKNCKGRGWVSGVVELQGKGPLSLQQDGGLILQLD